MTANRTRQRRALPLRILCDRDQFGKHLARSGLIHQSRPRLERSFRATPLAERGWDFAEVAQCIYARIQRGARGLLEEEGTLAPPKAHGNGVEWVFWAEQPEADAEG